MFKYYIATFLINMRLYQLLRGCVPQDSSLLRNNTDDANMNRDRL